MTILKGIPDHSTVLQDVPANYTHYREEWDNTYAEKFRVLLGELDHDTLEIVAKAAEVDISETDNLFSEITSDEEKTILLYVLYQFLNNKRISVREFGAELGDSVPIDTEFRYVLKKILQGEQRFLYQVLLYHRWAKGSDKRRYEIENRLPDDYVEQFEENYRGIQLTLSQRTRSRRFRCPPDNRIELKRGTLFSIDRQTSDKEKRDVTGPQRRRNIGSIFLKIDEAEEEVIIQTKNEGIRNALIDKLEEVLSISLRDLTDDIDRPQVSPQDFEKALEADGEEADSIRILNAEFRRTNTAPAVPLTISKKSENQDIRPVVKALSEDVLDKKLENVRRFWFTVDEIDTRVVVERSFDLDYIRLNSDIKTQSERSREKVKDSFEATFGLPLDKEIPLSWLTDDRARVISLYLNKPPQFQKGKSPHKELLRKLEANDFITITSIQKRQCTGCDRIYNSSDPTCPNCGGVLEQFKEVHETTVKQDGIRRYFQEKVEAEDIDYLGRRDERIYQTTYEFVRIQHGTHPINVLLNTKLDNLTSNAVIHLRKSLHPVLIVSPGVVKNQTLIDQALADSVDLGELIHLDFEGELPDDYLSERIETISRAVEEQVAANARDSYERLPSMVASPESNSGEQFERELFHLFNQLVSNAEQWGSKRTGNVPDGFGEIVFPKAGNQYYRSFGYDAKFTKHEDLSLSTDESRTLRGYVHRIKDSEEVTSSKSKFTNFIVITNAQPGKFGSKVAARFNRMTSWEGTPVLMHVEFLLGLHVAYNENVNTIRDHISTFYEEFYLILNNGNLYQTDHEEEFYVHLTGEDVEELMTNFEAEIDDESLNISELRKFLEKDLFP